jgi:hypothetical protein
MGCPLSIDFCLDPFYITFVPEIPMDFDTDLWSEIQDAPGEIFDIPELNDEKFDFNEYLSANYDY